MKIKIKGLYKNFDNYKLFENLNLDIASGSVTCLYGVSGCGKTTLLNIIGMIEDYSLGEVYYDDVKVIKEKEKRKYLTNKIGFIFQNFGLVDNLTVVENIKISKKNQKISSEIIENALNKFGLINIMNRKIYELSGGEQQRVALTKVYLKNVELILADEPTASLDEENTNIVMNYLKEFAKSGKTVIIVSHDNEIKKLSDYAYNIDESKR